MELYYNINEIKSLRNYIYHTLQTFSQVQPSIPAGFDDLSNEKFLLPSSAQWWLLGTSGCHLCEQAQDMLRLFCEVYCASYHLIDIAFFEEDLMMQFADKIPVLLTPSSIISYPFSLADLQQLLFIEQAE